MTHSDTQTAHITPANGNIFADLGFAPEEAAALLARSRQIIDEKLQAKADQQGTVPRLDNIL